MLRWLRPLLFWLLIATLPLKGLAAVVWAGCGPLTEADVPHAQHTAETATDPVLEQPVHGHHHHHHADPSAHAHVPLDLFGGLTDLDVPTSADASTDVDTSSHCHHSAPCCTAVAPAPDFPGLNLPPSPTRHGVAVATEPADVVIDVPHRPPRRPLA